MLRGALVAFVAGWVIWLWVDKSPAALGPLPWPADGEVLQNFQVAIDLVKQARFKAAFVYLWKAHFIILSLGLGLLLGAGFNALSRGLARRRFHKLSLPKKRETDNSDTT